MLSISVTILTKNSQRYLARVLEALKAFDEVIVFDTGSTDETLAIAAGFGNVKAVQGEFIGFGPTHNLATQQARNDWVFSVDSDEVASVELIKELSSLHLSDDAVYSVPRKNIFRGKEVKGCGWSPDRQYRLYNRLKTCFNDAQVHEQVVVKGLKKIELQGHLEHYSYSCSEELLSKMRLYAKLFAEQNAGRKSSSLGKAICHGAWAFIKTYLIKLGVRDGAEGVIISLYNAQTAYYKYLLLAELNQRSAR